MTNITYTFKKGKSALVAAAIHEGHETRESIKDLFHLNEQERLREEDPFTVKWASSFDNQIIVHHSRFETDVNRPRDKAVYIKPEDAWGLQIWKKEPAEEVVAESLSIYDGFYAEAKKYFDSLFKMHENIVVYDLHSYNHRREGKDKEANADENPEVNFGTKNMNHNKWEALANALMQNFTSFDYNGRSLDVRENVKFKGGYFGQWLYEQYGDRICPISIEFKKFFMDEWTGKPFDDDIRLIGQLVENSKHTVEKVLKKLDN